jgi:glycosyltransferase involved in cell wall biosynthesis
MRVLHLIPSMPGGGAERQLALLALEFAGNGLDVHVGYLHGGVNLELLENSQVHLHRIYSFNNHDPLIVLRLVGLVRRVKPQIIQTWLTQMDVFGGLAAAACDIPFVLSERASAMAYPDTWKHRLRIRVGRRAAAIIANSNFGAEYWKRHAPQVTTKIIRNGIPFGMLKNAERTEDPMVCPPAGHSIILFAGRFTQQKNIPNLICALTHVLGRRQDCCAVLFGEGPLKPLAEELLCNVSLRGRIHVGGFNRCIWYWMRRASVFVSPSLFEGNPNTVQEAMALKCPLVVSDIPEHREILDETTAVFCDPGSARDIANAIEDALTDQRASTARARRAQQRCVSWSIEARALEHMAFYESIVQRRTGLRTKSRVGTS